MRCLADKIKIGGRPCHCADFGRKACHQPRFATQIVRAFAQHQLAHIVAGIDVRQIAARQVGHAAHCAGRHNDVIGLKLSDQSRCRLNIQAHVNAAFLNAALQPVEQAFIGLIGQGRKTQCAAQAIALFHQSNLMAQIGQAPS